MSRNGRRSLFNNSTDNIVRRGLRPLFAFRGIIKTSISVELHAPQELEPAARHHFIHNGNCELRSCHRAIESGPRLEHARAAINNVI